MSRFSSFALLLALTFAAIAPAQPALPASASFLPLLQAHGWFLPVSVGPTATFETVKQDVSKRLNVRPPIDPLFELWLASMIVYQTEHRLRRASPERKAKVWARLLDSVWAARRTGIVQGITEGSRGDYLHWRPEENVLNQGGFWSLLRSIVVRELAQLETLAELDDRPGPVRNHLKKLQNDWQETRRRIVEIGIGNGDFRADTDPAQVGFELFGLVMAYHHSSRLLDNPQAETRARTAFTDLIARIRKPEQPS